MIEKRVQGYIRKHHMIETGDRVLIGLSGGADSAALFHILRRSCSKLGFELLAVHVDHGLRGMEARRDRKFVEDLCRQYQIPCQCEEMPVRDMAAQKRLSLEEAGREARREAFRKWSRIWRCDKLALAHHKNDQAETMLHHLARGTGLTGLAGLSPADGFRIRPLLCLERREIEHYLEEEGFAHVEDSTNQEDAYTRNRIRHGIIGELESQVNARAVEHMARTAGFLRQADTYLKGQGRELLGRYKKGEMFLDEAFFDADPIPAYYGLRGFLDEAFSAGKDITSEHYERLLGWGRMPVGKVLQLPYGIRARREYGGVSFYREREDGADSRTSLGTPCRAPFEIALAVPGETEGPGFVLRCRVLQNNFQQIPQKTYTKWLNYDKIKDTVKARTRRPGDYLTVNASGGKKKLKEYFIDCKVPRQARDQTVLIAQGPEVLWVVDGRINEAYKVQPDTKEVLELVYEGGYGYGGEDQRIDPRRRGGSEGPADGGADQCGL